MATGLRKRSLKRRKACWKLETRAERRTLPLCDVPGCRHPREAGEDTCYWHSSERLEVQPTNFSKVG
jgi:hypothetical protein